MPVTLSILLALQAAGATTPVDQTASPQTPPSIQSAPAPTNPTVDVDVSVEGQVPEGRLGVAQQQAPGGGDVVVTARRRSESVQSVPIAISVIGGTALAETGTYNVNRLTQIQPTLQFFSTNPRNTAVNIRGLGAPFGLTNDGIEQGVGVYVDQVFQGRVAATSFDFTDTERIEVLRGPQGTLYGKNTTSGAINIVTRTPSFTPEARVEVTGGNLDFLQARGSVSGPIVGETVAARLSLSLTTRRGTILNVRTDEYQNSQDNLSIRGQMLFRAAPNLDVTVYADWNRQDPDCCVQIPVRVGVTQRPASRQFPALAAALGYTPPSLNAFDRLTDIDVPLRAKNTIGGFSLLANWDLGAATVTSVSAFRFWDWVPSNDRDFIGLPITTQSANPSQQKQYSQELRIASNGENRVDYVLGGFYFFQTIDTQGLQVQGPAASRYLLNPPSGGCVPGSTANACNPAVLNGLASRNTIGFENTSAALFGKLTWHVTDRLEIAPGLRLNYDKKTGSYLSTVTTGAGAALNCSTAAQAASSVTRDRCGVLAPQFYEPEFDDWNVSGDVTASYDFSDDVHGYATFARSYKSGGINLSGVPLDAANNPILASATVKPEKVNHYELGLKTQFFGRRATVNVAAFRTEIEDYQATVTNGQLGVLRGYLANAGKVRTQGVEVDTAFRPTDRVSLYLNGAYPDAEYVRFVDAPCPPELSGGAAATAANPASPPAVAGGFSPPNCDISGQAVPGVSKLAVSYGAEYNLPVGSGFAYAGVDGSYRSRFSSNPSRSIYTDIEGYSVVNFRAGYRIDGDLNVFAFLRNAFDEDYFDVLALQPGNTGLIVGQPADPRTYGITLSKSF
jgi:iron complex outermembrane receptor protein